jgi:protein-S-isoprenylcysteine O-methyltransferase Ste14
MTDKFKAYALVAIQMAAMAAILLTGRPLACAVPLLILQAAGVGLGIWAVAAMGVSNTHVAPLVAKDAVLVTAGPYALIRHPMYSAVLLALWPLVVDDYSPLRLAAAALLTVDLCVKMLFEEGLLKKRFAGYEAYMKKTRRLIPFIL